MFVHIPSPRRFIQLFDESYYMSLFTPDHTPTFRAAPIRSGPVREIF